MSFWIRQAFLLLTCVVLPFSAALYVDTVSEVRRAENAGTVAAKFATQSLETRLTLDAQRSVSRAISMAQRISDRDLAGELSKKTTPGTSARRDAAVQALNEVLKSSLQGDGFAWYVDETGAIVGRTDQSGAEEKPQLITGHPLFAQTQEGFALDGLWKESDRLAIVGAAPVMVRGAAQGAVLVGTPINRELISGIASAIHSDVTLTVGGKPVASTLEPTSASAILSDIKSDLEVVAGGALSKPLKHAYFPMLPLFVPHDADGFAYVSMAQHAPGGDDVRWVVSASSADVLRDLASRQEIVLAGLISFFMLALLIGLMNYRSFVSPIERLTDHLSELQLGRGELEMPETRVSAPFRRLVRLINMTVQKIPARGFSTRPASESSPINELALERVPSGADLTGTQPLLSDLSSLSSAPSSPTPIARIGGNDAGANDASRARQTGSLFRDPFDGASPNALSDTVSQMEKEVGREHDESDAIAQAIASLEASTNNASRSPPSSPSNSATAPSAPANVMSPQSFLSSSQIPGAKTQVDPQPPKPAGRKTAADIRGRPSESIASPTPFAPSTSEMFRGGAYGPRSDEDSRTPVDSQLSSIQRAQQKTAARSGGSLNLHSPVGLGAAVPPDADAFSPESTVVAPVADDLLRKSAARDETTSEHRAIGQTGDMTMVASVPANLLAQTMSDSDDGENASSDLAGLDPADHAHFKETYERFIEMRKRCGEATGDLAFDRFLQKLAKNREGLIKKYNCRTVRFQVYEKDGKAALKATPVRAR